MSVLSQLVRRIHDRLGLRPPTEVEITASLSVQIRREEPAPQPELPVPEPPEPPRMSPEEVKAKLEGLAANHPDLANWKISIVDLMKLVEMDSSLEARRDLAHELHYHGSLDDTATMNTWLHGRVVEMLATFAIELPHG